MEPKTPSHGLLDEVEQKIGRNVLLLQRMEGVLKFLLAHSNVSGYIREIQANHEQQIDLIGKWTLGRLVGQFTEHISSSSEEMSNEPEELKGAWVSFNFKVQSDAGDDELNDSLASVVLERNELIHHFLPKFDLGAIDGVREAIEYLDQQREKILPVYEELKLRVTWLQEMKKEVAAFYASEEGKKYIDLWFLTGRPVVGLLRDTAAQQARPDGWAELSAAEQVIQKEAPQALAALKKNYGQPTLKGLLLATGWFEVQEEPAPKGGGVRVWYREKHERTWQANRGSELPRSVC